MTDPRDAQVIGAISTPADGPPDERRAAPSVTERSLPNRPATSSSWTPTELRRRFDGLSLQTRLLAILVVALLAALTLTGYGVQLTMGRYLVGQVDNELLDFHDRASHDDGFLDSLVTARRGPNPVVTFVSIEGHPELTQISGGRPSQELPNFAPLTRDQAIALGDRAFSLRDPHGAPWRAVAVPVWSREDHYPGVVVLALPVRGVGEAVTMLRVWTLVFGLAVLSLGAWIGWIAIRRSFRPLLEVEDTAAAIAAGDLSRRIPERPATTEVGRLTASLNGMLTQIESAFRAQAASEARTRRFAADASHELRTPLVSIRGFAELYRQGAVPPDEVPRTMGRIENEAKRMGSLVEDLLLLARLDEQRPGRKEPVDLAVLAGDAVHDARGLDADRTVRLVGLGSAGPVPAVVTGDEDRLRQVVANLVANAVRHTPAGTPIEVAVGTVTLPVTTPTSSPNGNGRARPPGPGGTDGPTARTAVLEVRDHGQGLTPEQADRVFERFYRVDSSRRRDTGGGSGLGLSIVSAVVASHSGHVSVSPTPGGGATFRVVLPAAPLGAPPDGTVDGTPDQTDEETDGRAGSPAGTGEDAGAVGR